MLSVVSREVFQWTRRYEVTRQIPQREGLSSDFAMHVTSVVWAFNFAKVLEPELNLLNLCKTCSESLAVRWIVLAMVHRRCLDPILDQLGLCRIRCC